MSADGIDAEWEDVSPNPDPVRDLGYELMDLEVLETEDGTDRYMLLPTNEEMLARDAFIVADEAAVCDVAQRR